MQRITLVGLGLMLSEDAFNSLVCDDIKSHVVLSARSGPRGKIWGDNVGLVIISAHC